MTTKHKHNHLQTIAGVLGNVLEWYDFALYGFFSDIIGQVFFPPNQDNLLLSYIVFGGAFVARPFGGLIAGHVGDKHGRKRALVMSMISMSVPTFLMGCLPGYSVIGGWSTVLLVICRLAQGLSVGGQLPASVVYTVETKPKGEASMRIRVVCPCPFLTSLFISHYRRTLGILRSICFLRGWSRWSSRQPCGSIFTSIPHRGTASLMGVETSLPFWDIDGSCCRPFTICWRGAQSK